MGLPRLPFVILFAAVLLSQHSLAAQYPVSQASAGQSVAGVWKVRGVGYAPWTLKFKVDGDIVRGTVQQSHRFHLLPFAPSSPFAPAKIYNGSVTGDKISFKCDSPDHHGDRTIAFTGVIQGNEITFTRTVTVKVGEFRGANGIFGAAGASHFTATRDSHSSSHKS